MNPVRKQLARVVAHESTKNAHSSRSRLEVSIIVIGKRLRISQQTGGRVLLGHEIIAGSLEAKRLWRSRSIDVQKRVAQCR